MDSEAFVTIKSKTVNLMLNRRNVDEKHYLEQNGKVTNQSCDDYNINRKPTTLNEHV